MPHELKICKESHFGLKKKLFDLGYTHGFNGKDIELPESAYYLRGYQKGKNFGKKANEFEDSGQKTNTIDDYVWIKIFRFLLNLISYYSINPFNKPNP